MQLGSKRPVSPAARRRGAAVLRRIGVGAAAAWLGFVSTAGATEIEVVRAKFGASANFCNAVEYFRGQCDGQPSCEAVADAGVCRKSRDPLPGVIKRLTVHYRCGDELKTAHAVEGQQVKLTCYGGELELVDADTFVPRTFSEVAGSDPDCVRPALREGPGPHDDPSATCRELCVDLPREATIRDVQGWVRRANKRKWFPCGSDADSCEFDRAAFYNDYRVHTGELKAKVCWTFRNWATDTDREAKLSVQYEP